MTLTNKIRNVLDSLKNPTKAELKDALLQLNIRLDDLVHLPEPVEGKPYNRELLYKNDEVELLVMNWSQLECAPHDHGNSFGWIQVLSGTSRNSVYEVNGNGLPIELFHADHQKGTYFYAPKKAIHKMKAYSHTDLVTLHLYSIFPSHYRNDRLWFTKMCCMYRIRWLRSMVAWWTISEGKRDSI